MPLILQDPKPPKKPFYSIRGTYLRIYVDKSCGTDRRSVAVTQLRKLKGQIERGEYPPKIGNRPIGEPTFLSAAVAYMEAGGERQYVPALIRHFGETPLPEIDQTAIDAAAVELYPNVSGATRNRHVYTPCQAILRRAGIKLALKRPKGARGRIVTDHLSPEDARLIIGAAERFDPEFATLLRFLTYTGCRINEALGLTWEAMRLEEGFAWIKTSKNGDPRAMLLRGDLRVHLAQLKKSEGRVFRRRYGGRLKDLLLQAKLAACGLPMPERVAKGQKRKIPHHRLSWVNFHTFRHTFASWFRRFGGADVDGLVATGNWRDRDGAIRYAHTVPHEEWGRVEKLPDVG